MAKKKQGILNRIGRYFREVQAEVQKVVWPSRKIALRLTVAVLAFTAAMSVALGLIDWVFTKFFGFIVG